MKNAKALFIFMLGVGFLSPFFSHAATVIPVPFISQAPYGNWAEPWQNFCEEASIVMTAHYLWDVPLTPFFAELEMQIIKQYEDLVFGRSKDESIDEVAMILRDLYGFKNIETRQTRSPDDIKQELAEGRAVVVPVAGQLLFNPHFRPPGPEYHMVVIRGYDDARGVFITNEPGTRHGNAYEYPIHILFAAIHDLNDGDILNGEKKILVAESPH